MREKINKYILLLYHTCSYDKKIQDLLSIDIFKWMDKVLKVESYFIRKNGLFFILN